MASDPRSDTFLDANSVVQFCTMFSRFGFNLESLRSQLPVAKNLLISEKVDCPEKCYKYLCSMNDTFADCLLYFKLVLTIPVASASSERSFSSLKRIKSFLRTTMLESRTSNLSLISINRDLSNKLRDNPMLVVDEFGKSTNRRVSFIV